MDKPIMTPPPGERLLRFVGDSVRFLLHHPSGHFPAGSRLMLRTNLGKAAATRREIISSYAGRRPMSIAFWRDIPLQKNADGSWSLEIPLTEVGYFQAKAYAVDPHGFQWWPDGPDLGISVHPNVSRTGNTIYCAFTRMFGQTKAMRKARDEKFERALRELDVQGFTAIPPSGKLRDLVRELPHITGTLGCRVLHLLPVNPTPTTMARMGRFGSPYAGLDLTAIDPALVDFDQRTTGLEQFCELTFETHRLGARVFLDLVINHTGWGSTLFENHPEWFVREAAGKFVSPSAWGNVWADLVELDPSHTRLWEELADAFLVWCRRGVDGFRCDAGYKVPLPVWQYIIARVREEFPETVFLLEGLGGSWAATELLLTEGGMQWAYSELFQNYSGAEVQRYLDYSLKASERLGVYIHYSETHDNDRLAARGKKWSLLRNRLCALTSVGGGFGFTCGVEWLADEKIEVHQARGLAWDSAENIVPDLAQLNALLADHPCFFDGARLVRLSPNEFPVYALQRDSAEGLDRVLVLVNTDPENKQSFAIGQNVLHDLGELQIDLLGPRPERRSREGTIIFTLEPGAAHCLAAAARPRGLAGDDYRRARAQAAWGISALSKVLLPEEIGSLPWKTIALCVAADPRQFLATVASLETSSPRAPKEKSAADFFAAFSAASKLFPPVVTWTLGDARRITPVPPDHWLLILDNVPFRARLKMDGCLDQHVEAIQVNDGFAACFPPKNLAPTTTLPAEGKKIATPSREFDAELSLERYALAQTKLTTRLRCLSAQPKFRTHFSGSHEIARDAVVLLTNGIGGMARIRADLGQVRSKYDCALAANFHPEFPVDRHVFAKRIRVWANVDGFITSLNFENLESLEPGPPARWLFTAHAGDERAIEIEMIADMLAHRNTTVLRFAQGDQRNAPGKVRQKKLKVRLTVRVDIEDRSFHSETHRNGGADAHFATLCAALEETSGFAFTPDASRQLRVFSNAGLYHHQPEWSENITHPIEENRGQIGAGDAFSPGWFDLPLSRDEPVSLVICADLVDPSPSLLAEAEANRAAEQKLALERAKFSGNDSFGRQLARAATAFLVRRGPGKTVIAGYPWFLDWGRDSLICARGYLAAGFASDVSELLITFGRFVENGTMPNTIHGANASNRDTTDAPLWYGIVCEEAAAAGQDALHTLPVDQRGRSIADVLLEIARGYRDGTPNGICMDADSALIWSPSHFTWMDTNHPAGSPREGYPIEIQALWIRLLRQLDKLNLKADKAPWRELAQRAEESLRSLFWIENAGYFADCLLAKKNQPAQAAVRDDALRSNYLLCVALGLTDGPAAQRCVEAALRHLVVPGALRSLAPLPVATPLPIYSDDGRTLLNNPTEPYFGRYEGDEDTRRKPAYHNGTAWTWTFPVFCEALVRAWNFSPGAVAAARSYLGSMEQIMTENCLGQIPEILDGDTPHQQRGCDAQAWGVTEALRVWKLLENHSHS